jgi:hypothetical protein
MAPILAKPGYRCSTLGRVAVHSVKNKAIKIGTKAHSVRIPTTIQARS